jgi:putative ABC transport system permease protein
LKKFCISPDFSLSTCCEIPAGTGIEVNSTLWLESILIALRHLKAHPLRSILTILGFTIALASLLAMIGIGEGTRRKIIKDIEILGGASVISIQVNGQFLNNPAYRYDTTKKLSSEDIDAIGRASDHITLIVPTIFRPEVFLFKKNRFRGHYLGTTPAYTDIRNWKMEEGRFISEVDIDQKNPVCVIGSEVRAQLFGNENPIGKKMYFNGNEFTVVGVMNKWDIEANRMLNELVLIPITTTMQQIDGKTYFDEIFTKVDDIELVPIVKDQIGRILRERHENFENFRVFSQSEIIENLFQSSNLMSFTFGIISLIILFVGGIGIMNLMLVSVTERTREIGLYKAVGAKDNDIFRLFLFEAVFLSWIGGCAGILLGVNGSKLIVKFTEIILHNKIESIIPMNIIFLAFAASILLGIFFGLYPALNAARVDPGKALRYE